MSRIVHRAARGRGGPLVLSLAVLAAAALTGCSIRLISDYDELIDKSATEFHQKLEKLLVELERTAGTPAADYANHVGFYDEMLAGVRTMRLRAASSARAKIVEKQILRIEKNIEALREMHKTGMKKVDIPPLRTAFFSQFTAVVKLQQELKRGR